MDQFWYEDRLKDNTIEANYKKKGRRDAMLSHAQHEEQLFGINKFEQIFEIPSLRQCTSDENSHFFLMQRNSSIIIDRLFYWDHFVQNI